MKDIRLIIDTKQDSQEDIRKAISFLQSCIEETQPEQEEQHFQESMTAPEQIELDAPHIIEELPHVPPQEERQVKDIFEEFEHPPEDRESQASEDELTDFDELPNLTKEPKRKDRPGRKSIQVYETAPL